MAPRPPKGTSAGNLIHGGLCRRTVFIRETEQHRAPQELWDIVVNGSDVVLIVDAPDEGFSAFGDRVVVWNDPDVTIDGVIYQWPEHSKDVKRLFEP
jgi:hypothetical protein